MKKSVYKTSNYTGRIFICINNDDQYIDNSENHFTVGKEYYEAKLDSFDDNIILDSDNCILLIDKFGVILYADANGFVLISRKINKIALQKLWLN
jgi:hypothetical protein